MSRSQGYVLLGFFLFLNQTILPAVAEVQVENLIAHYKVSEGSEEDRMTLINSAQDSSIGSATIHGASWTSGIRGNALKFDGYDDRSEDGITGQKARKQDYIEIPGLSNLPQNITLSVWAQLSSRDTHGSELISLGDRVSIRLDHPSKGTYGFYQFYQDAIKWDSTPQNLKYYSGTGWHHFVYVIGVNGDDGKAKHKLFVDGEIIGESYKQHSIDYGTTNLTAILGRHANISNAKSQVNDPVENTTDLSIFDFKGLIGDIRIYGVALNYSEVKALYRETSGLIGLWKFSQSNADNKISDSSGNNFDATINGGSLANLRQTLQYNGTGWSQDGQGKVLQLSNGQSATISGLLGEPAAVTLSAWAKLDTLGRNGSEIISLGDHAAIRLLANGQVAGFFHNGSTWVSTKSINNSYETNRWHHFVYSIANGAQNLYVDGAITPVATTAVKSDVKYTKYPSENTTIGRHGHNGTNYNFSGQVGEVRVYNRALSTEEVNHLYKSSPSYPEKPGTTGELIPDLTNKGDSSPFTNLTPINGISPTVLDSTMVKDVSAVFVADPFLFIEKDNNQSDNYYLFMEVLTRMTPNGRGKYTNNLGELVTRDVSQQGDLGLATSKDGITWKYDQIILDEPISHLSYPYVFKYDGKYYMIPETNEMNEIRLYQAKDFPYNWSYVSTLVKGKRFMDSSIFRHDNKWWMFSSYMKFDKDHPGDPAYNNTELYLFYSEDLSTGWQSHPLNPLIGADYLDFSQTRLGGRSFVHDGQVYRVVQNNTDGSGAFKYGTQVRVFNVTLDEDEYSEKEIEGGAILTASEAEGTWNQEGMHHFDPWWIGSQNKWLNAVDGYYLQQYEGKRQIFSIRLYSSDADTDTAN
ncbi:MAG: hypothetical protein IT291_05460 [Deltaproteobacteria bacterium]|nr:hypothetical protein [Deltaproteobacteria bacterium]